MKYILEISRICTKVYKNITFNFFNYNRGIQHAKFAGRITSQFK
jgi:hypothetical protein